ncbi:hypothetical protein N658DRAFT_58074 [Parathielavia hyrcaniae]|uniref:Uncharacterized protein n=1 Tax=Parathielavia hyrcaniae TaxID=113614 RepID=A0AAN6Q0P6_9PEZI|nr:hypothetical protein N658DRAFT_58074 [Parathielavia hyrcaniae]
MESEAPSKCQALVNGVPSRRYWRQAGGLVLGCTYSEAFRLWEVDQLFLPVSGFQVHSLRYLWASRRPLLTRHPSPCITRPTAAFGLSKGVKPGMQDNDFGQIAAIEAVQTWAALDFFHCFFISVARTVLHNEVDSCNNKFYIPLDSQSAGSTGLFSHLEGSLARRPQRPGGESRPQSPSRRHPAHSPTVGGSPSCRRLEAPTLDSAPPSSHTQASQVEKKLLYVDPNILSCQRNNTDSAAVSTAHSL